MHKLAWIYRKANKGEYGQEDKKRGIPRKEKKEEPKKMVDIDDLTEVGVTALRR